MTTIWTRIFLNTKVFSIVLLLISSSNSMASSVREVTLDEALQQSQLVFDGSVVTVEANEDSPKRIYTYVTFDILEIIKGKYQKSSITLRFLGGTFGNVTMAISDMQVPQIGERGIYFVESLERLQVHPFYGWSQGHFIVEPDQTGIDRVKTNRKQSITEVGVDKLEAQSPPDDASLQPLSRGVARGLIVAQDSKVTKGLTANEFKNILKERLRTSQ
jgi:hypothetical protein